MNRKEILKTIIVDNQNVSLPTLYSRELVVPVDTQKIVTLSGVRRSGKTYHLFMVIKKLLKDGVMPHRIIYFNFEDERLTLALDELDLILQAYQELYPQEDLKKCYFFFDEIQEIPSWERFIARLYASVSQNIFITGSNAKLLSREIASSLRGRALTFEVYPLSFSEFVSAFGSQASQHTTQGRARLVSLFSHFMSQGGFPELLIQDPSIQESILQDYFDVMLLRDLIERYAVSQTAILKYFCKRVVANSGYEFSVNKLYNDIKSQGYQIAKDTLYNYQDHIEAIYLAHFVSKYSYSLVKSEFSQKKSYVIDPGMGAALDFKFEQDRGRVLETTIALELLKKGKKIAYYKNGSECDFIVVEKGTATQAIQVTLSLEDETTRAREIKGLVSALTTCGLKTGTIVTLDEEETIEIDTLTIQVVPAWNYCLNLA